MPTTCSYGKLFTSPDGNGVTFLGSKCQEEYNFNSIFQLKAQSDGSFKWVTLNQTLRHRRLAPIVAYIDESKVNCYPKTTPTTATTNLPGTTIDPRQGTNYK